MNITTSDFFSWNATDARVWFVNSSTIECTEVETIRTHGGGVNEGMLYNIIFQDFGVYKMCLTSYGQNWTRYDAVQVSVTQAPSPPPPPVGGTLPQRSPPPPPAPENVTLIYVEPYESFINYDKSNTVCCMALTASCEACKSGTTVVDYCNAYPDTTGCDDAVRHKVYTATSEFAGQGRCANEGSLIAKLDGDQTFARKTLVFYHSVFKNGNFPNDFQFQKNYQYVKYDRNACANFEIDRYTRLFDTTTNNAHGECKTDSPAEFPTLTMSHAAECLLACDLREDCQAFTFYPNEESYKCKIHTVKIDGVDSSFISGSKGVCYTHSVRNPARPSLRRTPPFYG